LGPANQIHEAVGPQITAILNKALAQKPEERYSSANEFREALRRMGRTSAGEGEAVRKAAVKPARASTNETLHVSEITSVRVSSEPGVSMALVGSAKRVGPTGATAVLALIFPLAAGILYASQRLVTSGNRMRTSSSASDSSAF